ncbi:aquaporin [soil metagenome]
MATKKAAPSVKKSTAKKPTKTTKSTKSTTVKAVATSKPLVLFRSPLKGMPHIATLIAEFIGTFLFAGAVIAGQGQPIIILFALAGIVMLVGTLSGAHLNPAITIGAFVTRKITGLRAIGYIVAQFLGALTALGALNAFIGGAATPTAGYASATLYQAAAIPAGKEWYIFFAEVLGTAILGFAIATVIRHKADRVASAFTAGLGIFVALLLAASAAAYVGGTAIINPAVALSLNALKWELWPLAAYVLAPIIGAVVGFIVQDILQVETDKA